MSTETTTGTRLTADGEMGGRGDDVGLNDVLGCRVDILGENCNKKGQSSRAV